MIEWLLWSVADGGTVLGIEVDVIGVAVAGFVVLP